jgi:hypothetical protein
MHFKKDIIKLERNIVNTENRILKEKKLFEEKKKYSDINVTKDYTYLFFDGTKLSYSTAMGEFQQLLGVISKETNCTVLNTQWQDMPMNKKVAYDVLSLKLFFQCKPKSFITFQNHLRKTSKLFVFDQLKLIKNRRKNVLNINATVYAFRSKEYEK